MKKISHRQRYFSAMKARRGNSKRTNTRHGKRHTTFRPFEVEVWDGENIETVVCLLPPEKPPAVLCLRENTDDTLKFLHLLSERVSGRRKTSSQMSNWITRKPNQAPQIKTYIGFESISVFATAPALILAATYERAKIASGEVPVAVNFPNWSPQAFQTLYEIGFFEIVGHAPAEQIREVYVDNRDTSYKVSKILTGTNADGLEEASDVICELLDYLSIDEGTSEYLITEINSAVSEAMINVARHAYSDSFAARSSKVCLKKWWLSAKADQSDNTLTIALYDQGETIPGTLPRREWYQERVERVMKAVIPNFIYASAQRSIDHEYINYSMKKGKTQTGETTRGLGLPQMQDLIDICPDGTLSILSRQGLYRYDRNIGIYKRSLDLELEGTLVEWKLTLPGGQI